MSDAPKLRTQIRWLYPLGVVLIVGLLWWADGRLWPSTAAYVHDSFWFVMMAQLVLGSWLRKSRFGQVFAVLLDGAFFWVGAQWAWGGAASDGARRWIVLVGGGVTLALTFVSVAWERFPAAWRARVAASRVARGAGICLIVATVGGFLWLGGDISSTGNVLAGLPWTMVAILLSLAGGLALALWWLHGWRRVLACWAIASLTWVSLMTGLATGGFLGAVGMGGWLLAIVPPLIGGGVTTAYWRIREAYGA